MPESPSPPTDRVLSGRYQLVQLLARGGMAEVWEGHDLVLARPVAVKLLHPHLAVDDTFTERFRREAVAAARLVHPGIVATYDAGTDGQVAFIVMELVKGQTLRAALESSGPLPTAVAVPIAAQVADALHHAHAHGLVHRDVKPANILLADQPGGSVAVSVKVADFGIARMEGGDQAMALTQTGAVVGTAAYLSPEQVTGAPPDARSDGYALGVVLYEMLCGSPPFVAETDLATALLHVRADPAAPRRRRPAIPAPLEAVVLRAMAKEPVDRFQTLAELRDALVALDLDSLGEADRQPTGDTAVLTGAPDTPPAGLAPQPRPAEPRRGPLAGLVALSALAVVVVALLVAGGGGGGGGPRDGSGAGSPPQAPGRPVAIAAARSFDPLGDGEENESRAALAVDGNPSTTWNTKTYNTRPFGGLKTGVGLVIELDEAAPLAGVDVRTATRGWAAELYLADGARATLADWGRPVARSGTTTGDASFELGGEEAGAVLLWITDTGQDRRAEIGEVVVRR